MEIDDGMYRDGSSDYMDDQNERTPWYQQPQFTRFWQHYAAMQSWMQMYVGMHRARCSNRYPSTGYPLHKTGAHGRRPHLPADPGRSRRFAQRTSWSHPHWRGNGPGAAGRCPGAASPYCDAPGSRRDHDCSNEDLEDSDESEEIEISPEMLEFFRTSQKFREERDRAKAAAANEAGAGGKTKTNHAARTDEKNDCRAPVERPDEGRRRGMKLLYGKHSARIHSMETAMQMQFDRNCDRLQPALWPIVALKL